MKENNRTVFSGYKILAHQAEICNWILGKSKSLIVFEIDLTNCCNNKCPKCTGMRRNSDAFLSIEETESYIRQAVNLGAKGVIFTGGGDPLLCKYLKEAILFSRNNGLDIVVMTNGLALTQKIAKVILKNCIGLRISLDAGNPGMYKKTHGMEEKYFFKTLSSLKMLQKLREEKKYFCEVGVGYLTGVETVDYYEMEDFVKVGISCGLDYVQFRPFHYDFTPINKHLEKLRGAYGNMISIMASEHKYDYFCDIKRGYLSCYGANFETVIGADANMYICCHHRGNKKYSLGNLRTESMEEIWNKRKKIIDKINFNDCVPLCRCDEINRVLHEIKKESKNRHRNFL